MFASLTHRRLNTSFKGRKKGCAGGKQSTINIHLVSDAGVQTLNSELSALTLTLTSRPQLHAWTEKYLLLHLNLNQFCSKINLCPCPYHQGDLNLFRSMQLSLITCKCKCSACYENLINYFQIFVSSTSSLN